VNYPSQVTGLRDLRRLLSSTRLRGSLLVHNYLRAYTGRSYRLHLHEIKEVSYLSTVVLILSPKTQRTSGVIFSCLTVSAMLWGDTPFQFDRQKAAKDLTLQLNYASSKRDASVRAGLCDLVLRINELIPQSVTIALRRSSHLVLQAGRWQPNPKWRFRYMCKLRLKTLLLLASRLVPILEYEGDSENPVEFKVGGR